MPIDKSKLVKFDEVSPLSVRKYEQMLPYETNQNVVEKLNDVIESLARIGMLNNQVVSQWNNVMKWIRDHALEEVTERITNEKLDVALNTGLKALTENTTNEKINELLKSGQFEEIVVDSITIIHNEVNAELTSFNSKISDLAISVKSFEHLVLNGDWRNAIQTAINSMTRGKVILHQDIAVSDSVILKDNIHLDFMGYKIKTLSQFPSNNPVILANGNNITVQNFVIEGNDGNKVRGIQSLISTNIKISNGSLKNIGYYGLLLANAINPFVDSITFESIANNSLDVSDPYISGTFRNDYVSKAKYSNLKFVNVNGKALSFSYSNDCFVDVVDIRKVGKSNEGANGSGIYINYGSDNINVNNLYTEKTGVTAIKVSRAAKNVTFTNSLIVCKDVDKTGIDFYALLLQGAENTKFISCKFVLDMARYGVQITNHEETMDVSKNNQFINCEFININPFESSVVINQDLGYGTVLDNCKIDTVGYAISCGLDTTIKNGSSIKSSGVTARAVTCKDRTTIKDSIIYGGERGINLSGAKDIIIRRCEVQGGTYGISFATGVERADISYTKVKSNNHALFGGNPINSEFKFNDLFSDIGLSISLSASAINNKILFNNLPKNHNAVIASNVISNNFVV